MVLTRFRCATVLGLLSLLIVGVKDVIPDYEQSRSSEGSWWSWKKKNTQKGTGAAARVESD